MNHHRKTGPIVTLTLNPTLDVSWSVETVIPTEKLRATPERAEPGGGGVNVSRVCQRLGHRTVAVVALGGSTGQRIASLLDPAVVRPVPVADETRQSITVAERSSGAQFRFVLPGPSITESELVAARRLAVEEAGDDGLIVVSGSMPPSIDSAALFDDIMTAVGPRRLIVDTSGPALTYALNCGAHLIKPSAGELASIVGRELETEADVIIAADEVISESRVDVLVASIGAGGAYLVSNDGQRYRLRAPAVKVRSAVGAGDSMVAGLAVAIQRGVSLAEVGAYAVAAGTSAVMTDGTELSRASDLGRLLPLVSVEPLVAT